MDIVITIYLAVLVLGVAGDSIKAFMYWRGKGDNSRKLTALMIVKTGLDIAVFCLIIWLWYGDIASSWTIVTTVLPIAGALVFVTMLYENKLATGKFSWQFPTAGLPRR